MLNEGDLSWAPETALIDAAPCHCSIVRARGQRDHHRAG